MGKKLVDHAAAGIYLGPAYPTPGHLVYFIQKRIIAACVHVSFDESSFLGVAETPIEDSREASDVSPQVVTDQSMQLLSTIPPARAVCERPAYGRSHQLEQCASDQPATALSLASVPPAARALPETEVSPVPFPAPRLTSPPPSPGSTTFRPVAAAVTPA